MKYIKLVFLIRKHTYKRHSYAISACELVPQRRRELIYKVTPVFLSHFLFKAMKYLPETIVSFQLQSTPSTLQHAYLMKRFFEVLFRVDPRCNCITEENKVLYNSSWVNCYHCTHSSKCTILFFIITNITQRFTPSNSPCILQFHQIYTYIPRSYKLLKQRSNFLWAHKSNSPNSECCTTIIIDAH